MTTKLLRSPYEIPGLAPDTRRCLMDEWNAILAVRHQMDHGPLEFVRPEDPQKRETREQHRDRLAPRLAEAIEEYRRVADLWRVDVERRP